MHLSELERHSHVFKYLALPLVTFTCWTSPALSADYSTEKIASGLLVPWGMAFADDNTLLVTERNGHILSVDIATGKSTQLMEDPAGLYANGQGGLLDIAMSPFEPNKAYVTYSKRTASGSDTTLATFTFSDGKLSDWKNILTTTSNSSTNRHYGSRVTFDEQYLYMSVGDRGERDNGQDLSTHAGSILRLNPDGSAAEDNPFVEQKGAQKEIWSFGHRNPQGLFYDSAAGALWSIEHGPRGGDEINFIRAGSNYGWPITSHGKEYWGPINVGESKEKEGIESPIKVYVPSIAPSSLLLYRGKNYPELNGKLLAPALKLTHINVVTLNKNNQAVDEIRILSELNERIRHVIVSPKDELIFSTDQGNIYRLVPTRS
ncbi:Soluble aldose sugar dehydrogenase YliI precursor [Vibrio sp. THAF191c]|nr:Soluble aldose sugar dehydrogenase YliI precursor [Vibrio sp. THAF64]QGM34722.1 Soluble aldose sugar dehydrogenase YliI precursor [Vibrio sp. THAF191d]QGN70224.1 Soluble aldose sugar dehydrogenase YliI precursor [Vibrio sp. THAF191c]